MHELLRHRLRTAVIALLRHRFAKLRPASARPIDPWLVGWAGRRGRMCNDRLRGLSDRRSASNDVVTVHDCHPLSRSKITRGLSRKLRVAVSLDRHCFGSAGRTIARRHPTPGRHPAPGKTVLPAIPARPLERIFSRLKSLMFFSNCFVPWFRRNNWRSDETIFRLSRRTAETTHDYEGR